MIEDQRESIYIFFCDAMQKMQTAAGLIELPPVNKCALRKQYTKHGGAKKGAQRAVLEYPLGCSPQPP